MCIRCRCNVFTCTFHSNHMKHAHVDTDWWKVFMNYAAEIAQVACLRSK
jgi:hypothetical protein